MESNPSILNAEAALPNQIVTESGNNEVVAELTNSVPSEVQVLTLDQQISQLSPMQLERFIFLSAELDEQTSLLIAKSITSHGINSWASVQAKIKSLRNMPVESMAYFKELQSEIKLGEEYSTLHIMRTVSLARKLCKLEQYGVGMLKKSVSDFLMFHLAETVMAEDSKKLIIAAYRPIVNLNSNPILPVV